MLLKKSYATSFVAKSVLERVKTSEFVVSGTVKKVYNAKALDAFQNEEVFTFYEVELEVVLKGDVNNQTITVRQYGDQNNSIIGTVFLQPDQKVVLFLIKKNLDQNVYLMNGLISGSLPVHLCHDEACVLDPVTNAYVTFQEIEQILSSVAPVKKEVERVSVIPTISSTPSPVESSIVTQQASEKSTSESWILFLVGILIVLMGFWLKNRGKNDR
jgi:hypothetical protein